MLSKGGDRIVYGITRALYRGYRGVCSVAEGIAGGGPDSDGRGVGNEMQRGYRGGKVTVEGAEKRGAEGVTLKVTVMQRGSCGCQNGCCGCRDIGGCSPRHASVIATELYFTFTCCFGNCTGQF